MSSTRAVLLAAALLGAAACSKPGADSTPGSARAQAAAASSPACGTIVYAAGDGHEHGQTSLAIVSLDDGEPRPLGPTGAGQGAGAEVSRFPAALSPDGRTLLVLASTPTPSGKTSDRFELLGLDGDDPPTLLETPTGAVLRNPGWAPDGSFIVFESDVDSFRDLYRHDLVSSSTLRLTDDHQGNFEPAVSPDGQRVAFVSSRDGNAELYVMSSDGGGPQRLTTSPGDDTAPRWSPDGRELAFLSARDRARGVDVFLMPATGGDARPLLAGRDAPIMVRDLVWSPDGSQLAFTQLESRAGQASIVVAERQRGAIVLTTDSPGIDEQPSWSPDGLQIAFTRGEREHSDLFRIAVVDGAPPVQITPAGGIAWLPRWFVGAGQDCARAQPATAPIVAPGQG